MKAVIKTLFIILISLTVTSCDHKKNDSFKSKEVYKTKNLIIKQISKNSFQHTSFLQTESFGNVPCNGLIFSYKNEVIIFDTPTDNSTSEELIKWVNETLDSKINAIIPTHFHDDCLGGLKAFHQHQIPSHSYYKTIELAKENNSEVPQNSFKNSLVLKVGNKDIIAKYFGEGHTKDNVVGYFPYENIMFGGCLTKTLNASKGNLADANVSEWSNTVEKIKLEYPNIKIVVPGHGKYGDMKLLDYTINLFKTE
ncbi:subclass B1 metallo-beta-lactamase [Tenacibaculum discolor]|uniref:subclass B1 metallo-beta-lactamase n=1 Tax=Tenacibaculum discolor TaxID=361581 RepID=UPI003F7AD4C6